MLAELPVKSGIRSYGGLRSTIGQICPLPRPLSSESPLYPGPLNNFELDFLAISRLQATPYIAICDGSKYFE